LCIIYKGPNSSDHNNKLLLNIVAAMCEKKWAIFFLGDFNFQGIDWNNWCFINNTQFEIKFINLLRDMYDVACM